MMKITKLGYFIIAILLAMTLMSPVQATDMGQINPQALGADYEDIASGITDSGIALDEIIPLNITRAGQYEQEGTAYALYIVGDYLYMADGGNGLEIYDISDPVSAFMVGRYDDDDGGVARDVVVEGDYAYLADYYGGLEIIDISDPSNPFEIGSANDSIARAEGVFIDGNFAYVADGNDGMEIVNITDPTNPVEVGQWVDGGAAHGVVVNDTYAYLAHRQVSIIDISDPTTPLTANYYYDGGYANDLIVNGTNAFVAMGSDGFVILDVSDPNSIAYVSDLYDGGKSKNLFLDGTIVYIADEVGGLEIINVTDPTNPVEIGEYYDGGAAMDVVVSGNYAYIADGSDGLEILDITDPENPVEVYQIYGGAESYNVFVEGDYAFVADDTNGLEILDISDVSNPIRISQYTDGGALYNDLYVLGGYAYVTNDTGFFILDVSDPANPIRIGGYLSNYGQDIFVLGDYAYLVDDDGMKIVNVTDPSNPSEEGHYDISSPNGIYVSGDYAYIAATTAGLIIIDVSDPTTPVEVSALLDGGSASDVYINGSYAYVADGEDGLEIIDISDPENPLEVGQFDDGGDLMSVDVDQGLVFVADETDVLEIYDVSNKSAPEKIGGIIDDDADGYAQDVSVSGPYAFVAKGVDGIQIYTWISEPSAPLNFELVDNNDASVTISWDVSFYDGADALEYKIYRGTSSGALVLLATVDALSYLDDTVIKGTEYFYAISAENRLHEGNQTDVVSIIPVTVSTAPQNLALNLDSDNFVELTWTAPTDTGGLTISNYTVNRGLSADSLSELTTVTGSVLEYLDATVEAGTTYFYAIDVNNAVGAGNISTTESISTNDYPDAPLSVALLFENDNVTITWDESPDDGGMDITSYIIYRGNSADNLTELVTVSGTTLQYNDSTVEPELTYFYAVSAVNSVGEGDHSLPLEITIPEAGSATVVIVIMVVVVVAGVAVVVVKKKGLI